MNIPGNGLEPVLPGRAYVGRDGCNMVGDHPLWRHAEYQYAGRAGTGVCPGLSGVGICFLPSCNVPPCEGEFISLQQSQQDSVLPGEEGRVALTPPHHITVGKFARLYAISMDAPGPAKSVFC